MKKENLLKLNILKRILGKKMVVITDYIKNEYYYAQVDSIIDESNVVMKKLSGEIQKISIFDLRSPSPDYP